jgi:hypothetical protein
VTRRIDGEVLEPELGHLGNPPPSERGKVPRSRATPASVEAELVRLASSDANSLARRWRVLFGRRAPDLPRALARVPAPEIEALVIAGLRAARPKNADLSDRDLILNRLHRVSIHDGQIEIATNDEDKAPICLPWPPRPGQRRREIFLPQGSEPDLRPMKVEDRSRILKGIARGRAWLDELLSGQMASTDAIAIRERCSERSIPMTLSLAFLSPEVVQAIIAGRLARGIGITRLADLPPSWSVQPAALGV